MILYVIDIQTDYKILTDSDPHAYNFNYGDMVVNNIISITNQRGAYIQTNTKLFYYGTHNDNYLITVSRCVAIIQKQN